MLWLAVLLLQTLDFQFNAHAAKVTSPQSRTRIQLPDDESPPAPEPPQPLNPADLSDVTSYTDTLDGATEEAEDLVPSAEVDDEFNASMENDLDSVSSSTRPKLRPKPQAAKEKKSTNVRPVRITKKGDYLYNVPRSPQNSAFSLRVGNFNPSRLRNPSTGRTFSDVYSTAASVIVVLEYEWQFLQDFGKLGVKGGTGFHMTTGQGFFQNTGSSVNQAFRPTRAQETYTLFTLPNSLSAIYRAQYWRDQILVPYVDAGLNYYTLIETRDDSSPPKFQGALAGFASLGLAVQLNRLNQASMYQLDQDYGINNIYLVAEYRMISGFNADFDFTDNMFSGGLTFEF